MVWLIVAYRSFGRFWQARHPPRYAAFLRQPSPSFGHSSLLGLAKLCGQSFSLRHQVGDNGHRKAKGNKGGSTANAGRKDRGGKLA